MSAERPAVGINHPDREFVESLTRELSEKQIDSVSVMNPTECEIFPDLDALILRAKDGFEVPENIASVFIDEPSKEHLRSEWASRYLDEGAVGYFPSNENPRVIAAYMKNLLDRGIKREKKDGPMLFGDLTVDKKKRLVLVGSDELKSLRKKEFDLLAHLIKNPGVIFTREQILEAVWGLDFLGETRTVDVCVGGLRRKLEENRSRASIKTVIRVGYGLVKLDEDEGKKGEGSAE